MYEDTWLTQLKAVKGIQVWRVCLLLLSIMQTIGVSSGTVTKEIELQTWIVWMFTTSSVEGKFKMYSHQSVFYIYIIKWHNEPLKEQPVTFEELK